jgi:hypothetical protein
MTSKTSQMEAKDNFEGKIDYRIERVGLFLNIYL